MRLFITSKNKYLSNDMNMFHSFKFVIAILNVNDNVHN